MKPQAAGPTPAGLPYRRINFVPARDVAAHSVQADADLVPLNVEVR